MAGEVKNHSSKTLWVVETDSGPARAHKLAPGRRSPSGTDADGFKAVDGTPIGGHTSWWKVTNVSTADVSDSDGGLSPGCLACLRVGENEFGPVTYDDGGGWGEPIG